MRQTWIFQGFPGRFDMGGYLETRPATLLWLVTTGGERIRVGDQVFLWRSVGGDDPKKSGIVAEAEVLSLPERQTDSASAIAFWHSAEDREHAAKDFDFRVRLRLRRVANAKEIIRRDWLKEDPIASDLTILKRAAGTNFFVPEKHQARLRALWAKTGTDWTYQECVAGLWAFHRTYGNQVSKLPGSPVSEVAVKIGRVVSGVYNKVMNFRALDPRDERQGFSGGSENDSLVWRKFYDDQAGAIRAGELEAEYERLWSDTEDVPADISAAEEVKFARDVKAAESRTLDELIAECELHRALSPGKPRTSQVLTVQFDRDSTVAALARVRAGYRCEMPDCSHPVFLTNEGTAYCEVHHIEPLSEGGEDSPENVACLCPAHHREAHFGRHAKDVKAALIVLRRSTGAPTEMLASPRTAQENQKAISGV